MHIGHVYSRYRRGIGGVDTRFGLWARSRSEASFGIGQ